MKVQLCGEISTEALHSLREYIASLDLETEIQIEEELGDLKIQISKSEIEEFPGKMVLNCPRLNYTESFEPENLNPLILECCGYKRTVLSGLNVKDSNNNKIKPLIDIFIRNTPKAVFPRSLKYSKTQFQEQKLGLVKEKIHFSSEILSSLLSETTLCFEDENQSYELLYENTGHFIQFVSVPVPKSLDFLTDWTVNGDLLKHIKIKKNYPVFEHFLTGKVENLVFNKKFYGKIKNSRSDLGKLLDFVEHAPKFQDGRDDVVRELSEFIYTSYPLEHVQKCQYLDVHKSKIPTNKNKHNLNTFLSQ